MKQKLKHFGPLAIFILTLMMIFASLEPSTFIGESQFNPRSISRSQTFDIIDDNLLDLDRVFWSRNTTGKNQTIAIVDTGINDTHQAFNGKQINWTDVTSENETSPMDLGGHGTACASIATGNATTFKGAAPGADLAIIKMFYTDGSGVNAENQEADAAVDYILDNPLLNVSVASLSWSDDNQSDGTDELSMIVERLVDAGIVTVVAAGNEAAGITRVTAPGTSRKVITVGAMDTSQFEVAGFSLPGPTQDNRIKPDLIAPGRYVKGANYLNVIGYNYYSGTSFATPIVAGVAALLLEEYPGMTHYQIKNLLCLTALETQYTQGAKDNQEGWGVINPAGVLMAINNTWQPDSPLPLQVNLSDPWKRSYFTKVHLSPGQTNQFSLRISSGNADVLKYYELYIFDKDGDEYGDPHLHVGSHYSRLYFLPPKEGDYILALKPHPSAWTASGDNLVASLEMDLSLNYYIEFATVMGIISAGFSVGILVALGHLNVKIKKRTPRLERP
ncbi:MAG: S8 family serine peptidase [Candidatus Hodarchaeota archaeon]